MQPMPVDGVSEAATNVSQLESEGWEVKQCDCSAHYLRHPGLATSETPEKVRYITYGCAGCGRRVLHKRRSGICLNCGENLANGRFCGKDCRLAWEDANQQHSFPDNRPVCPMCDRIVHKYSEMHSGSGIVYCSYNCLQRAGIATEYEEPAERGAINTPCGCLCEPCPIDLESLFVGAEIHWEDDCFKGTTCGWHKEVWCKMDGVRGIVGICVSGADTLYGNNRFVRNGEQLEDFCETWAKSDWPKMRKLITKFV